MQRFFFDFASKDAYIRDTSGRELSDLATAHRHAMLLINKMVSLDDMEWLVDPRDRRSKSISA
jgi:hypothetical protein